MTLDTDLQRAILLELIANATISGKALKEVAALQAAVEQAAVEAANPAGPLPAREPGAGAD